MYVEWPVLFDDVWNKCFLDIDGASGWLRSQRCEFSVILSSPIFLSKMVPEFDDLKAHVQQELFALTLLGFAPVCLMWEQHDKKASALASENMVKANDLDWSQGCRGLNWREGLRGGRRSDNTREDLEELAAVPMSPGELLFRHTLVLKLSPQLRPNPLIFCYGDHSLLFFQGWFVAKSEIQTLICCYSGSSLDGIFCVIPKVSPLAYISHKIRPMM